MILILTKYDLNRMGSIKNFSNVQYLDIAESLDPVKRAGLVIFMDEVVKKFRILKSVYIEIDSTVIHDSSRLNEIIKWHTLKR